MRNGTSVVLAVLAVALGGCASQAAPTARTPNARVSVAMDEETHRALLGLVDDEENVAVGTTTLTGADIYLAPAPKSAAREAAPTEALPEDRGSLGSLRTWGVAQASDVDGIPTSRE